MTITQKPPKKDKTNPGHNVPPVPKTAKDTMDFRGGRALRAAMAGAGVGQNLSQERKQGTAVMGQVFVTKEPSAAIPSQGTSANNIPGVNEAETLEQGRQNRKFLPYANVHTLISETLNRNKNEWLHNHEKTGAAVAKAVMVLAEQKERDIGDDYTRAKHGLVKGFGDLTQEKETLYDFEMWLIKKEREYESLSGAYSEIKMLSFAPYEQVIDRCREMIQTSVVARDYYIMVGNTSGMNGAGEAIEMHDGLTGKSYSTIGELEKLRFDVWLQTWAPMGGEDGFREKDAALFRVGELLKTVNETDAKHAAAEARADRAYGMLELVDEEADELDAIAEKRYELMTKQVDAINAVAKEMAGVREENQKLVNRVSEMESNIGRLTARLEGRDSGETLTEEDAGRETMLSGAIALPPELVSDAIAADLGEVGDAEISDAIDSAVGDGLEDLTGDAAKESSIRSDLVALQEKAGVKAEEPEAGEAAEEDAAALVAAAEAVVGPELPQREITKEIPLEEVEEIEEPEERGRFWKTLPGRVIDNIFVYGFKGEGEKRFPPTFEDFAGQENQQQAYLRADQAYKSWYGQTGRGIRKTLEGTRKNWKAVTAVATGVAVLAAATTGYFMYAPAQERSEQVALRELQKPTVTQVAVVDEVAPELDGDGEKIEPKPEPLEKPALADVLAKHNLKLEKGTNMAQFYKGLTVEDVQEKYVILEEALGTDEQLQKYERKYSEKPILEMYADFLTTAMAYVELAGQEYSETANVGVVGVRVAKRLEKLTQQKRIKKKLGKDRASEMNALAGQFIEFANELPSVQEAPEQEKIVEVPVVTPEELEEMKKAGEEPEIPVIILPDKTDEKPFDVETEMGKVVKAEFESLDSVSKVNEFNRKAGKADKLGEKFLMRAHITDQLIEHKMGAKMSEKRVLFMHIDAMNAAILFARAEGQGMTAKAEALNAFELADAEVKRFLGYKKMKKDLGKKKAGIDKNLKWLRNRAKELKDEVDNYNENKGKPLALPGSPAVDNENGAPTAIPETVKMDRTDNYSAMQTKVFSDHGLSIVDHPLKVKEKMKGMKINSFDKFIIMEKLADDVLTYPNKMGGLTKAEQFEMLGILADFLDSTRKAANEPKHWPSEYARNNIMLDSLGIDVSDLIHKLRKKRTKDSVLPQGREHLWFPLDEGTFKKIGAAAKTFDEQLNYEYMQKKNKKKNGNGNHGE